MFNPEIKNANGTIIKVVDANDDEDLILQTFLKATRASNYRDDIFSEDSIEATVASFQLEEYDERIMIVLYAEDKKEIVGLIAGVKSFDHPMFRDNIAIELVWWTEEGLGWTPIKLYNTFLEWAKMVGCVYVTSSIVSEDKEDKLTNFYTKKGFKKVETTFMKEL